MSTRIVLGISGASGMPYALTLAKALGAMDDIELHMVLTNAAQTVLRMETGLDTEELTRHATAMHHDTDIGALPASGSWQHDGMIVCPCSMNTLAAVGHGLADTLMHRACDVTLKERRPLILVARETPLNRTHLTNMLAAHDAGATILPAMPGFYHRPASIDDLVEQLVARILDQLGLDHHLGHRWGE